MGMGMGEYKIAHGKPTPVTIDRQMHGLALPAWVSGMGINGLGYG